MLVLDCDYLLYNRCLGVYPLPLYLLLAKCGILNVTAVAQKDLIAVAQKVENQINVHQKLISKCHELLKPLNYFG